MSRVVETQTYRLNVEPPDEIVVVNGASWKCPIYVRKMPPCRSNCRTSEDIRGYLTHVAQSADLKRPLDEVFDEAWHVLTDKNPFPAVHGRICPHPCEDGCNRKHKDSPVAINNFERFVGDHGIKRGLKFQTLTDIKSGKKVAVVGAGPSGLSCAYQLARRGHSVVVFESAAEPGGMLRYGIPSYRLPREILSAEIKNILDLGVELRCDAKVGADASFQDLRKNFDAVYVAVGAQKGGRLGVAGDDLPGVLTGVDFLNMINRGKQVPVGRKAVIVGGGNTAMDAARVALRLGADVTILYRRTKNDMPAIHGEIREAEQEGIKFLLLSAPVGVERNAKGSLVVKCAQMRPGEKDASGRSRPVPVEGSEFSIEADTVISAVGQTQDLTGMGDLPNDKGRVLANSTRQTSLPDVFAGGDAVAVDLAVTAVGHGRKAAKAIHAFLNGQAYKENPPARPVKHTDMDLDYYPPAPRNDAREIPLERRVAGFEEITAALTMEEAVAESRRCMSCGLCFSCDRCRVYCPRSAISRDKKRLVGQVMFSDYTRCAGCHICRDVCPSGYIEMGMGL
ncbi:MAG: NAD(P)-binding protein [Nitrospinae bacterium]|nr:NAD(P)-binding protein [Nitrospinota bacterium]